MITMVTRIIYATLSMACCRDGQQVYNPYSRQVIATQTKKYFEEPINSWKKRAEQALYEKYNYVAKNECATMGTLTLCSFNLIINEAYETKAHITKMDIQRASESRKITIPTQIQTSSISEIKPTPKFIYQQMELIQERMIEADNIDEFLTLKNELNRLRERYRT